MERSRFNLEEELTPVQDVHLSLPSVDEERGSWIGRAQPLRVCKFSAFARTPAEHSFMWWMALVGA
eukprot:1130712-Amphidinium_carterae.1